MESLSSQSAGAALIASLPSLEGEDEVRVVPEEIALTLALSCDRRGKLWFKTFFATEVP
jgi:hypothetical protein